ncbi:ATP-dependent helicase HrpB [Blastochloris tepida]|uniref:ATP-dependent helicase n=1 Tax=Blastochloris tepida TaxID=2233851 RepID=A0A348G5J7_9HYPH|nr:ATP-dependent helicase HrpB [Blastochloris tepida]BBF94830.1 ATP-dependent helicase [Blastochloris tepida]
MAGDPLPVDEALPGLTAALRERANAVLVAPPGAGKTTRVPLVLLDQDWAAGRKILLLEPRRLAARAAAARMAATLGERVGDTVGLRVRFASQVSARTRLEVVTEGVFTRLILDDPTLEGVAAVIFDEYHERSLDADLGLALALDAQGALRPDLKLLVMSATLDGARVARLLGEADVIESQGRAFPVDTRHVGRNPALRLEDEVAACVRRALAEEDGSLLVFLPGAAEIRRVAERLTESVRDPAVDIAPLYGALDAAAQDRAVEPSPPGRRKVVLATSIAETSLTIAGVRGVIDCGLARVPRYEPDVGLTRLETVRVSRAAADQRRGRAGRTEPGVCWRLWDEPQTMSLPAFATPEILAADLASLVLDLAAWGVTDPATLAWLDPPPAGAWAEARALLVELDALDAGGRLTEEGRALRRLPLHPRLARMVVDGARAGAAGLAAEVAAILSERGLGGDDVDLDSRLQSFRRDRSRRAEDARRAAAGWARLAGGAPKGQTSALSPALLLALAYPDRLAKARGRPGAFLLANGRGAGLDPATALAKSPFLAVGELAGAAAEPRILIAGALDLADIETHFAAHIEARTELSFDTGAAALRARKVRRLGALALAEAPLPVPGDDAAARALAEGVAKLGLARLPWTKALVQWRDRVAFLRKAEGEVWPDLSDAALAAAAAGWLAPHLVGRSALADIDAATLEAALHALVPWDMARRLDAEAPTHFTAPTGSRLAVDYAAEAGPTVSVRVQELFGLSTHPALAGGRVPLVLELLSPAHRPIQVTRDLPGFWKGSWSAVRAEMRGRYPKHPWPEDPAAAVPTTRAKPRGT